MSALRIEHVPVEQLRPDPRNPRAHPERQIKQILRSIETFGFNVPILADREGNVLAGHGRLQAAQRLGFREIPVIRLEHLTPEQARAFAIADNRLAETSSWDDRLLAEVLRDLSSVELNFDLEATGFTMGEIDLRIEGLSETSAASPDPADELAPALDHPPLSRPGDLWQLGPHRLLCGSALDHSAYDTLMQGASASVVMSRSCSRAIGLTNLRATIDSRNDANRPHAAARCRGGSRRNAAGRLDESVWSRRRSSQNPCRCRCHRSGRVHVFYRSQHELVFVFKNGRTPHRNNVNLGRHGRNRSNVWHYPSLNNFGRAGEEGNLAALHPTVKPVALIADAILDCSARGDLVLDPFLGSGSTLLAAERVGRVCRGMELDPLYVDAAIRRWQRFTGGSAVHAVTGIRFDDCTQGQDCHGQTA